MANYIASVALKLHDEFSGPALKAKAAWADLENGAQKVRFAGAKMVDVGKKATIGITVPFVAAGAAAIKAGVDFNKGLANVASLGVAENRVRELGKGVQGMAVEFGQSTASLNEGLYNVISAFGDTADTSKILAINTKAATAGMATTSEAIALTSAVTKGYGDTSATAMQKAADLAFQTVKLGQTTFPELASSIGKVTGNANALGVSQEDLFAVFATTTGVVGSAAEVSSSTAAILNEMIKPGKALAGAIAELGYSSSDAMIKQLGFGGAIQALGGYAHSTDKKITNLFSSSEAGRVAMNIAGASAETYNQKLKEMYSSSGALDEAFTAKTGGINKLGFQFEQLKAQVVVSAQNIGQNLMPALSLLLKVAKPITTSIGKLTSWFSNLPQPMQNTALAAIGIVAATGPISMVAGAIMTLGGSFMAAVPKAYAFAVAHWAALGPMLIIVAAIAAVVAVGVLLYKNWNAIMAFGVKVWNGIVWAVKAAFTWFSKMLNHPFFAVVAALYAPWITIPVLVVKTIMSHWEPISAFFIGIWRGIVSGAKAVWGVIVDVFTPIGAAIVEIWQSVGAFFTRIWSGLLSILKTVGAWFSGIFMQLATTIIAVWQPVKAFFADLFSPVVAGFKLLDKGWKWLVGGSKKNGKALPETMAQGVQAGTPQIERASLGMVNAADQYIPHSNAKKGPLSRLSQSGEALVSTIQTGANKRKIDLKGPLSASIPGKAPTDFVGGVPSAEGKTSIHIENLTVQAESLQEISDFVHMLQMAGNVA